jgi:hypothetical protein
MIKVKEVPPVKKVHKLFEPNIQFVRCRCQVQVWVATHWMTFIFLAMFAVGLIIALQVITLVEIVRGGKSL